MNTIIKKQNRLLPTSLEDTNREQSSMLTLVWHIVLHNRISLPDISLLQAIIPSGSLIFIRKDENIIYESNNAGKIVMPLTDDISFSHDADFSQQIYHPSHGMFRLVTTPLDKNCLVGLLMQSNNPTAMHEEDIFLHKIHSAKKLYQSVLQSKQKIIDQCQNEYPVLVINKDDNQIVAFNNHVTQLLPEPTDDVLQLSLKHFEKTVNFNGQQKIQLKNLSMHNNEYSVVEFILSQSDKMHSDKYTNHLLSHTEYLLQLFHELQTVPEINQKEINNKINNLSSRYKDLLNNLEQEQTTL